MFLAPWQEYPWPVLTVTDASHWQSPATQGTTGWKARVEQREGLIAHLWHHAEKRGKRYRARYQSEGRWVTAPGANRAIPVVAHI